MPPPFRILIADDEPPARARLRREIESRDDCEIVAECGDGASTVAAIVEHAPDIVLLDIQMPELTGLEVLANLPDEAPAPAVIFCTAYDQHALEAFDLAAVDYLLKPWARDRLHASLERAMATSSSESAADNPIEALLGKLLPRDFRLTIRDGGTLHVVRAAEIQFIRAAGNYLEIHTEAEELLHRETLSSIERRLAPHGFFRLGRSLLVNVDAIRKVHSTGSGKIDVELLGDVHLPFSGSLKELEAAIQSRSA